MVVAVVDLIVSFSGRVVFQIGLVGCVVFCCLGGGLYFYFHVNVHWFVLSLLFVFHVVVVPFCCSCCCVVGCCMLVVSNYTKVS